VAKKEAKTDLWVHGLLQDAGVQLEPQGSTIHEINEALKTASKSGSGKVGFPEFVGVVKDFLIVIENKADLAKHIKLNSKSLISKIMKWYECNSIDQLKELGSFKEVKKIINTDFEGKFVLKSRGWSNLLEKISFLSNIFGRTSNNEIWHDGFVSETEKYLFCLLKLDGQNRQHILGVSGLHYKNKEIAKLWRRKIIQKIHTDKCSDSRAPAAVQALEEMYQEMLT